MRLWRWFRQRFRASGEGGGDPSPQRPPINEDWAVGDLAEMIVDDSWIDDPTGPVLGDVRRVTRVAPGIGKHDGVLGWGLGLAGHAHLYDATGFRKVSPQADAVERCAADFLHLVAGCEVVG